MGPWNSFGMMSQCYPCIWNATYRFQRVSRSNHRYIAKPDRQTVPQDTSHFCFTTKGLLLYENHLQVEVAKLIILFLQNSTDCRVETVMDDINGQEQIWSSNSMQCQQAIGVSRKTQNTKLNGRLFGSIILSIWEMNDKGILHKRHNLWQKANINTCISQKWCTCIKAAK